ncbi:hypothetical protein [Halovivax gelatinilyticus]|uniref:hypothetical protein n=1 Tax=Halovivax gelatinilyticus TaxID=2961597 RepID=UPI0020CA8356|nr:hypothetical protein [Halovivax gelatinilyticus]
MRTAPGSILAVDGSTIAIALLGLVVTVGLFVWIRRDAARNDVSRPRLWGAIASGAMGLGFWLYLTAPVPMTGVIMTANTGLVLYGFEREIASGDERPAEPGSLPHEPISNSADGTDVDDSDRSSE